LLSGGSGAVESWTGYLFGVHDRWPAASVAFYRSSISSVRFTSGFFWSIGFAGVVFFTIGALKSFFVEQCWFWVGLEILGIGGVAAGLAYLVGAVLKGIADMV